MDMRVPLRRLEIFCLVVEGGSVTRAAEQLMIAQPAVSAQLRTLERSLDAVLFVRVGNRLTLTEAGQRVHAWAAEVLAGCAQMQYDVDQLTAGDAGSLVVHASMAIGTYLLPPVLTRLRGERGGAEITLHVGEPAAAIRAVETGSTDFAVATLFDMEVSESLTVTRLWDEPIVLAVGPDNPYVREAVGLAEVARLPLVGTPVGVTFDRMLRAQFTRAGARQPDVLIRLGHAEAIKQAAVDNGWGCLVPRYVVAKDVADGRMRALSIRDATLVESIGLYHRTTKYFSPLQQAALDALHERAREQDAASSPPIVTEPYKREVIDTSRCWS